MDPVAHSLVGAALAETGLKKLTRYAAPTLIIGANLPDVDVVAHFWGGDHALLFRRGWSHGVLALVILPLLLAAGVWLWHKWRGRPSDNAPPLRMGVVLALAYLATWSHPLLDWLNTYGIRLLMPFDERWFYGDTLFIVDPWMWLLAAAGVVLARSGSFAAMAGWGLLAALMTWVILGADIAPLAVKLGWLAGIATLAVLRWRTPSPALTLSLARTSFAVLVLYVCVAYGLARVAESTVAAAFPTPIQAQANPVPGNPTSHRVVLEYSDHYTVVQTNGETLDVPRREPDDIVQTALQDESIRGFANWMRFPYWDVEDGGDHWVVSIRDLRYLNPGEPTTGIGLARVKVPKQQ